MRTKDSDPKRTKHAVAAAILMASALLGSLTDSGNPAATRQPVPEASAKAPDANPEIAHDAINARVRDTNIAFAKTILDLHQKAGDKVDTVLREAPDMPGFSEVGIKITLPEEDNIERIYFALARVRGDNPDNFDASTTDAVFVGTTKRNLQSGQLSEAPESTSIYKAVQREADWEITTGEGQNTEVVTYSTARDIGIHPTVQPLNSDQFSVLAQQATDILFAAENQFSHS